MTVKAEMAFAYLRRLPRQARATLAFCSTGLLLLLWVLLAPLVEMWGDSLREIDATRPRLARLIGFEESGEALDASLRKARNELELLVYPDNGPPSGAALQQLVRDLADGAGLGVARSQPMGGDELDGLQRVRVNLELGGSAAGLAAFLEALAEARPLVLIDSLSVQPRRQRGDSSDAQLLAISVRLSAYRVAST